jgi:hypothetical protein
MGKNAVIGLGIGAVALAGAYYLYKKVKKKQAAEKAAAYEEARSEGMRAQASEEARVRTEYEEAKFEEAVVRHTKSKPSQERHRANHSDIELYHPMFTQFLSSMDPIEADDFIHSYLLIKRVLAARFNQYDFECRMSSVTGALKYALEKKFDKYHIDRPLLGETAKLIKEEINKLMDHPSEGYMLAAAEIEKSIIRGEGDEIFEGKFS